MLRNCSLLLLLALLASAAPAQSPWTDVAERDIPTLGERYITPVSFRSVRLDAAMLQTLLAAAPERFTPAANHAAGQPILDLPMPDGRTSRFRLTESPVMAPALQAQYPGIRCYTGRGIDDPTALLKCDWTPRGFHAMVVSATQGTVFIDPYSWGDTEHYSVYFKKDYVRRNDDLPFICDTETADLQEIKINEPASVILGDCQLRRYRLALACTGEYAVFHGGTVALALAAMNTTLNRVNGLYENDLAITLQLIANNSQLIYLNGASDPYSNGNAGAMLSQNQTTCTNVIGAANYDIGHVFGTNSGGIAGGIGIVCSNNSKARGVTGSSAPIGDPFDIDYVAHEMGHQFGGDHTYNGTTGACGGNGGVEPGSGTTIMAYAGICDEQDVEAHSDDYFHAFSVQQINNYTISGTGNTCGQKIASGNSNPVVNAGANYTIPKSTPFVLTATGSDANGDAVTYCWEQMDAGATEVPPAPTSTSGALFRSFKGTTSTQRWFPRLSDLVNNINYEWEELPGVARTINFRVLARDNHDGAGCTAEDDMIVTVAANAGPFTVTVPNTNELWYVGDTKTVTWAVSNTNLAPVNCANVRILLSTDGGFTYPVVLAANVPNTGLANVTVPSNLSNQCRVKVESVGNIFFDISNQNFRIESPPVPSFSLTASVDSVRVCTGDTLSLTVNVASILGFSDPVQLVVDDIPAGASFQITPSPATPGGSVTVRVFDFSPAAAGQYDLSVRGTSSSIEQVVAVHLDVVPSSPASATGASPSDGQSELPLQVDLAWNELDYADDYQIQVATNPAFTAGSMVLNQMTGDLEMQTSALQAGTVYYWRVRASNLCGVGDFSPVYAFQTGDLTCDQIFISTDVPKIIPDDEANTIVSILNVPVSQNIADVDVTLIASHSYVGDLSASLVAPSGDTLLLFDRPGVPASQFGCSSNNLNLIFDDNATQTAANLEATCNSVFPALLGSFQPVATLGNLKNKNAQGDWEILVSDAFSDDGGSVTGWGLTFCFSEPIPQGVLAANNPLSVPQDGEGIITNTHLALTLSGTTDKGKFTLLRLPQHGTLLLDGVALNIGDSFAQEDIDANLLVYNHNGDNATADDFQFDASDLNNFAWVHGGIFQIVIVQNNLVATVTQTQAVLCHNSATGQITVAATGLDGQYQYSLNGTSQASNVFSNLVADTYTVVVTGQFGFTATSNAVILSNPPAISASTTVADDDVTVTASGGTGVFEYSLDGTIFQTSNLFENLANGIYVITVRDANGCTATAEAIVAVNTLLATLNIQTSIGCVGGSDGVIVVNVGGGQAPFSYSINTGPFQPANIFSGLATGTYSVEVKDNEGFTTTTNTVTLTDPPAITVTADADLNVITVTASGGTGAFEYSLDGTNFQPGNTFDNLANGDYTVTVRDARGCTATANAEVNVPPLVVTLGNSQPVLCFGGSSGILTVNASGGVPPYQYALDAGAFQTSNVFTTLSAGVYSIQVRDAAGTISVLDNVVITEPPPLEATVDVAGNDVSFMSFGGVPPYQYAYNGPTPPVNLPNGDYALTVTDANGCTVVEPFTISVPPVTATIEVTLVDPCIPSATIEVTAAGGEAPYEYSLNNGPFQSSNTFTVFGGPSNVRVRDALGAIVQVPVNVNLPQPVQASATSLGDTVVASAQFGEMPYLFSIDGVNFQSLPEFPDLPNGTYLVTVKDNNGCIDTVSVTINLIGTVEPSAAWGLVVSPNPSAGIFQLTMLQAPAALQAEVFDAMGRRLRALAFEPAGGSFSATLDLRDLPQGTYLLRLSDGKNWGGVRLSIVR